VVYRLWEEAATAGLPAFDPPEILEADLSALLLDCAIWGIDDPRSLQWVDPPPVAAIEEARKRLRILNAIDEQARPTEHGKKIAALPLPPRLAHMLIEAIGRGWGKTAADAAVLLSERGLGGNDADLELRLARWRSEKGQRAEAARGLARNWLKLAAPTVTHGDGPLGACVALGFPDRVAKRRARDGADWSSVGGRGFRLDPLSPLAREEWLAVAEVGGAAAGARILAAAPIDQPTVESLFADRIESGCSVEFLPETGGVRASRGRRLGALLLSGGQDAAADSAAVAAALFQGVRQYGLGRLPWSEAAESLRRRTAFARQVDASIADLSDEALSATLQDWLPPLLEGKRRLDEVDSGALSGILDSLLGWDGKQRVEATAPHAFTTPAGSSHAIDYQAEGGPTVTARVQAFFGLSRHPAIAEGKVPLLLSLTSPAGRPIQTTRDLPGFWKGSWTAVAKEMRGRYPRHPWPEDPAAADPTLRTKRSAAKRA
jgi:ATP-dependent helicase HrpB